MTVRGFPRMTRDAAVTRVLAGAAAGAVCAAGFTWFLAQHDAPLGDTDPLPGPPLPWAPDTATLGATVPGTAPTTRH